MEEEINKIWYQMNMKEITSEQARIKILDLLSDVKSEQESLLVAFACDINQAPTKQFGKYYLSKVREFLKRDINRKNYGYERQKDN